MKAKVWEELYSAAALETDDEKLPKRIQAAKASIDARIHELQSDHGGTPAERHAICEALAALNVLRRELEARRIRVKATSERVVLFEGKRYRCS